MGTSTIIRNLRSGATIVARRVASSASWRFRLCGETATPTSLDVATAATMACRQQRTFRTRRRNQHRRRKGVQCCAGLLLGMFLMIRHCRALLLPRPPQPTTHRLVVRQAWASSSTSSARAAAVQKHEFSSTKNTTESSSTTTERPSSFDERKAQRSSQDAKRKRSRFIGLAKAVDRGQYQVTYQPGTGRNGDVFTALSGLPSTTTSTTESPSPPLFTVLGVESSCDDTGAAVVRSDGIILGEALASQDDIHEEWGGVVPGLAQKAHEANLDRVIATALEQAGLTIEGVDAIGVTVGPGLEICLRVGCNKARQLAMEYDKPFVGVHHLEAHILMARMENSAALEFPFLALLVSGGHCQILKCLGIGRYEILGGTLDDSLGEAFDKTARLLGLPVGGGGGPAVEKLAREGNATAVPLTVPLQKRKDCDFSYAGLKTNVRRAAEQLAVDRGVDSVLDLPQEVKADLAASFQHIAIKHLEQRLDRAMNMMETNEVPINSLALVGGVAANMELRTRLNAICEMRGWSLVVPPPRLCTDQGAMAAYAAVERLKIGSSDDPSNQQVYARYPFHYYDASEAKTD